MQRDFEQEVIPRSHSKTSSSIADTVLADKNTDMPTTESKEADEAEAISAFSLLHSDKLRDTDVIRKHTLSPLYRTWQIMMDIVFVLCGSIVLLLILPFVALLIVLDSPGPIFYSQERIGYRGKKFTILKFRSMHVHAEAPGRALWAAEHDGRVTRVGRFMRMIHLDELPQVFNIVRGEMSLIGPRPEREVFVNELEEHIALYRYRLTVKPGLTGWAQVNYPYANSLEDSRIKFQYDFHYIQNRTFSLDLLILAKTVMEVLSHHGT